MVKKIQIGGMISLKKIHTCSWYDFFITKNTCSWLAKIHGTLAQKYFCSTVAEI